MKLSNSQIAEMSQDEKLQALEDIWAELAKDEAEIESPAWHEDVLAATEARVSAGKEALIDWSEAKRRLKEKHG